MVANEKWFGASADFYNGATSKSTRFRQPDSSYLSKNFSSDGNTKTMTFSWWFKRGQSTQGPYNIGEFFNHGQSGGGGSQSSARITLEADKLNIAHEDNNATSWELISNNVFRDSTNWYHFVVAFDTTQSTNTNRVKAYVNGTELTYSTASYPNQNVDMRFGQDEQYIGVSIASGSAWSATYLDGYMCDINFVDGTALTPTSFGETKEGLWIPIEPSVTYGTNGYRLEFKQTGTGTASASTIGADTSGNTNHWTSNNFASDDSNIPDHPENNFVTGIGGLSDSQDSKSYYQGTWSEGNLKVTGSSSGWTNGMLNVGLTSGKWYAEFRVNAKQGSGYWRIGMSSKPDRTYDEYFWNDDGTGQIDGTTSPYSARVGTYGAGDKIMIALDLDSSTRALWFGKNGTWENSATESEIEAGTTTNAFVASNTLIPLGDGHSYFLYAQPHSTGSNGMWNLGQDSTFGGTETAGSNTDANGHGKFLYSCPDGFLSLTASNFNDVSLAPNQNEQANDHFDIATWVGDDSSTRAISTNFQPDFTWIRNRTDARHYVIHDSTRGTGATKTLDSATTYGEGHSDMAHASNGFLSAFASNSFTVSHGSSTAEYVNEGSDNYVGWHWKANGGTTTTNDASYTGVGDIDSVYQANTTSGFSIVTYTGDGQDNTTREIAHGLGVKPRVVMVKNRSSNVNWRVYHEDLSDDGTYVTKGIILNSDGAESGFSSQIRAVSSTTFTVRDPDANGNAFVNKNNDNYVAYCFAEIEGFSKHGIYEGAGGTDGTYVFLGFTPRWIMTKRIDSSDNWAIYDSARDTFNVRDSYLYADTTNAEATFSTAVVDFLSNGFKWRGSVNFGNNSSGTYIYMAFASLPMKFSNAI